MSTKLRIAVAVGFLSLLFASCSSPKLTPNRLISFDENSAVKSNRNVPGGRVVAIPTVCGPLGYAFLKEYAGSPNIDTLEHPGVSYEWIDIATRPPDRPPVDYRPKQMFLTGRVGNVTLPSNPAEDVQNDIMFNHPFGADVNFDIAADNAYQELIYDPNPNDNVTPPAHAEIEGGLLPQNGGRLWFTPQPGDDVAMLGDWIMDCAHPEDYHTEIHPPVFLGFARKSATWDGISKTVTNAFVNPYLPAQLFNRDPNVATQFFNPDRFQYDGTRIFARHFKQELYDMLLKAHTRLEAYPLLYDSEFNSIAWYVCAPEARPSGYELQVHYYFTVRPGVAVQVVPDNSIGCAQVFAVMNSDYKPWVPPYKQGVWRWADISANAGLDVLEAIKNTSNFKNNPLPKSWLENDPLITAYDPLSYPFTTELTDKVFTTDQSPYPLLGEMHVWWDTPGPKGIAVTPSELEFTPGEIKSVQVTNIGNKPIKVTKAISASTSYTISSHACTQAALNPGATCQMSIKYTSSNVRDADSELTVYDSIGLAPKRVALKGEPPDTDGCGNKPSAQPCGPGARTPQ